MNSSAVGPNAFRSRVAQVGDFLRDHQRAIRRIQWVIVVFYVALLAIPAAMPLPDSTASVFNNLTIAAQFAFWGLWWPFVLISIPLFGRAWCGLFCPEGALTEWASRHGRGGAIPRWMRWGGWPFVAFSLTTVYGQLVSVYQYPWAAAAVLGGSTIAAIVVGWLYGRNKRVWCFNSPATPLPTGCLGMLRSRRLREGLRRYSASAISLAVSSGTISRTS